MEPWERRSHGGAPPEKHWLIERQVFFCFPFLLPLFHLPPVCSSVRTTGAGGLFKKKIGIFDLPRLDKAAVPAWSLPPAGGAPLPMETAGEMTGQLSWNRPVSVVVSWEAAATPAHLIGRAGH